MKDGQNQYRFFNECGFYEVGYRLEGNTLHFPGGGTHTIGQVSDAEAQTLLSEIYGLVEVDGKASIRTKGFLIHQLDEPSGVALATRKGRGAHANLGPPMVCE